MRNEQSESNVGRMIKPAQQTFKNVFYGSGPAQTMDIYLPSNRSINSTKIVVAIHGGGFNSGNKDELTSYIKPLQLGLDDFAFFNISYRQATTAETLFPTQENDVRAALHFIINHSAEYTISKKIILLGVSAGGLLALLQGYKYTDPVIPAAVISFFAPTDLLELYKNSSNPLVPLTLQQVAGATLSEDLLIYFESSPVNFVSTASPPTLLFQGGMDTIVSPEQQIILQEKLCVAGVINQYVYYEKEGHGWQGKCMENSFQKIANFLNEYIN